LEFGVVNLRLIRLDRAFELAHLRLLRIDLLARYHSLFEQQLIALVVDLDVFELRLVFRELAFGLFELYLERTRIDLDERVTLVDVLAFGEVDFDDLAVYAAPDGDGVERRDIAQTFEVNRQVPTMRRGDNHGHNPILGRSARPGRIR